MKNPYREEILAFLVLGYIEEVNALTDNELVAHIQQMRELKALTLPQWAKLQPTLQKFVDAIGKKSLTTP